MTTVAVLADPPEPGFVLPDVVAETPLSSAETARLYGAMLADVCATLRAGGVDVLVNYRPPDQVPDGVDPEAALRATLTDALDSLPRFEVQVGETFSGRVGNTLSHLLDAEAERHVAATTPAAALLGRDDVGSMGMTLRSNQVAIAPAPGGRVALAGFSEPIDFAGAYAPPAVETLTDRAADASLDVEFLAAMPVVETAADLADAVARLRARRRAGRIVPVRTAAVVEELGLRAAGSESGLAVARESDRP
ncbi:MAG: hypothetical protein ABEH56_06650 [Salinirussus sp.]